MPMPPPVGEAESNPIMIAVMDAKPITAIVVLVRMGMAATPAATIFTPAASLSLTRATAAQTMIANSIPHIHRQSLENHNYYVVNYF